MLMFKQGIDCTQMERVVMKLKNLLHNQTFIGFSFVLMLALLFLDSLEYIELGVFINLILVANAILILNVVTKKNKND